MNAFDADLADLNAETFDVFADLAAKLFPAAGGGPIDVAAMIDRGSSEETLERSSLVAPRATARLLVSQVPLLRKGDELEAEGFRWRIAAAPTRPGLGDRWLAPVDELAALP